MKKLFSLILIAALALCIVPFAVTESFAASRETINHIDLALTVSQCGTHISGTDDTGTNRQTPQLQVELPADAPYSLNDSGGRDNYATWMYECYPEYSVPSSLARFGDDDMVAGTYYAFIYLICDGNHMFADDGSLSVSVTGGRFEKFYYVGNTDDHGSCTVIVSIDVEHVSDNTWTPDPGSYVNPSHDAPATHEEHTHCTLCGGVIESRTVTDALSVSEVSVTMPKLKEGDGYTIQYDEMFEEDRALPRPVVSTPDDAHYFDMLTAWVIPQEGDSYVDATEDRTFKKGDEAYILVALIPDTGYAFPFEETVETDPDIEINVEGGEVVQKTLFSARMQDSQTGETYYISTLGLVVKVTVPKDEAPETGDYNVTGYAISAVLSFSVLIAYLYTTKEKQY